MVTKQEQLAFAAKHIEKWKSGYDYAVVEKATDGYLYVRWPSVCASGITKKEWQQERDKMQKKQDNSWHERGEFPPVGCECEVKDGVVWHKTFIVGFDADGYCVYTTPWNSLARDYDGDINQYNFRPLSPLSPLRTEREKAIDEMVSVILDYDGYMIASATAELVARQLYDSGYHK